MKNHELLTSNKNDKKIVGLMGFKSSGKDTVAGILKNYGYESFSFAYNLKLVVSNIFGWDINMLLGTTPESRKWRDQVDEWWSNQLGIKDFTPRKALTMIGTDLFREYFNDNIWILSLINKINQYDSHIVITDIRFKNEFRFVKAIANKTYRVDRYHPEWENLALQASLGNEQAIHRMSALDIHKSEWDWLCCDYNDTISNKEDFKALGKEVKSKIIDVI